MNYYVYILSNATNTTIYVGVTNNLLRRMYEHRNALDAGSFTARYRIHKLVYYEFTSDVYAAIAREKQIKSWNRRRKNKLIETKNPNWADLYESILSWRTERGADAPECWQFWRTVPRENGLPRQFANWLAMTRCADGGWLHVLFDPGGYP